MTDCFEAFAVFPQMKGLGSDPSSVSNFSTAQLGDYLQKMPP